MERIVFVLVSTGLGGAEKQALLLAQQFQNNFEYDVSVVCIGSSRGLLTTQLEAKGITNYLVDCLFPDSKTKTLLGFVKLLILLRKIKPTILLPYTYVPNVMVGLIWRFTQAKKCIWNQRDEGLGVEPSMINKFAIKNISGFIANSKGGAKYLQVNFALKKEIYIIPNAFAFINKPVINHLNFNVKQQRELKLTMVANLSRNKDHKTVLIGFKDLLQTFGEKITLILAGRFDDQYPYLLNLAKELAIENNVVFLGEVDDIPALLNNTSISILSSYSEGFSNVILESMSLKVPIVASNISGVREVIGDEYEYLFIPGDVNDFKTKVEALLISSEQQKQVIETNYKRVEEYFSVEKLGSNSFKALQAIIDR